MQLEEREASQPLHVVLLLAYFCSGINSGFGGNPVPSAYQISASTRGAEEMGKGGGQVLNVSFKSVHFLFFLVIG